MLVSDLSPEEFRHVAEGILTPRQYRCLFLRTYTPLTVVEVWQTIVAEGYVGYNNHPVSLRTVEKDLNHASMTVERALLGSQGEGQAPPGPLIFAVVKEATPCRLSIDHTATEACRRLSYLTPLRRTA